MTEPAYAELQVATNFSFLEGASHAEELVQQAVALNIHALAVTDRNTLAGVVRAHVAARGSGLQLIIGARLDFRDGPSVLCMPMHRAAYGRLSRLITEGRRRAPKGQSWLDWSDLMAHIEGQQIILLPPPDFDPSLTASLALLKQASGDNVSLAVSRLHGADDMGRITALAEISESLDVPLVATNDVLYHHPARQMLQDVLSCIRHGCTIDEAGRRLQPNAERHLKSPSAMASLFKAYPQAIRRSLEIAALCRFSLDELRYEYPDEAQGESQTPQEELIRLTWGGAEGRYPAGIPDKVRKLIEHELTLIGTLDYAPYFLTVHDIVRYARSQGILCQGRGSAANSTVCYCLGITAVDPAHMDLLFERFISAERREPPDIDVDFEHERREEVIQYIYRRFGRERAGLAATVIHYRPRSAIREVGKVLGLSTDTVEQMNKTLRGWGREGMEERHLVAAGIDPKAERIALCLKLARELIGFPRHLSQHVGGFVITRGPLSELVPIENAAMADRTVIEWDKDDIDALGILKVDVLALGMLSAIQKAFVLIERHYHKPYTLAQVPQDDPKIYDMIGKADTIGVFQIESRAQMSMLPRLKPRNFYDLVIEVAIVRPGPIQGDMVHPYLRRRNGEESVQYPSKDLEDVLGKTLGVPLFQEQAMRIAIVAGGFTPAEADQLRRAMATFRHAGTIGLFQTKLIEGMVARGYTRDFAERCFRQIEGFGEYGFPESHAASFALLVYISAWIKCYYPAVFAAALLNSQPMGFYAPAQLVRDARQHGVEVRPADINDSDWDNTLEPTLHGGMALRLGLRQIKSLRRQDADRLMAGRQEEFRTIRDLWHQTGLSRSALEVLARADAFGSLGIDRRTALWQIKALKEKPMPLFTFYEKLAEPGDNRPPPDMSEEPAVLLPTLTTGEQVIQDYREMRLTLRPHPLALLRSGLRLQGFLQTSALATLTPKIKVKLAGLVLVRQRPGTASGVIFATIEDETGVANLIIWRDVFERHRSVVLASRLLGVEGHLQREGIVTHVIAERLTDHTPLLSELSHLTAEDALDEAVETYEARRPIHEIAAIIPRSRDFR